jgi:SAM-dependent methyltransferase
MPEQTGYQYFEDVNWGLLRLWGGRKGLRVLDAGCGFATTSARIQNLGNEVTGIEESDLACGVAAQRIAHVVKGDLQTAEPGGEFDAIIFADVLEHIAWPQSVLRRYLDLLTPEGRVFVSLPNVGLWSVRFAHLFGRWEYEETGVLDATHLRFFTRRTARRMLIEAGLMPVATTYNPGIVRPFVPLAKRLLGGKSDAGAHDPAALLNSAPYRLYLKTAYPLERAVTALWPGMLAFQMIYEAKRNT